MTTATPTKFDQYRPGPLAARLRLRSRGFIPTSPGLWSRVEEVEGD